MDYAIAKAWQNRMGLYQPKRNSIELSLVYVSVYIEGWNLLKIAGKMRRETRNLKPVYMKI